MLKKLCKICGARALWWWECHQTHTHLCLRQQHRLWLLWLLLQSPVAFTRAAWLLPLSSMASLTIWCVGFAGRFPECCLPATIWLTCCMLMTPSFWAQLTGGPCPAHLEAWPPSGLDKDQVPACWWRTWSSLSSAWRWNCWTCLEFCISRPHGDRYSVGDIRPEMNCRRAPAASALQSLWKALCQYWITSRICGVI